MNKRQAKKQYKKIHGHNPPKTAVTKYTPEEMEAMKVYNLTPEDIERIGNGLRDAFAEMFKTLQRVAESMARVFEDMGKKYSRPVIETEEPPVVVARTLSERRKSAGEKSGEYQRGRFLWSESPICSGIRSSGRFPGQIRGQNLRAGQSNRHNHGQRDTGRNNSRHQRAHGHDIHSKRGGRCAVSSGRLDVGGQQYEKCKGIQSNPGRNL